MSVKMVGSVLQTGIVLETVVNEFVFSASWESPGASWEVSCVNRTGTGGVISEKQLRDMVTAFKEAKARIGAEIQTLEDLIKPYVDHLALLGERDE